MSLRFVWELQEVLWDHRKDNFPSVPFYLGQERQHLFSTLTQGKNLNCKCSPNVGLAALVLPKWVLYIGSVCLWMAMWKHWDGVNTGIRVPNAYQEVCFKACLLVSSRRQTIQWCQVATAHHQQVPADAPVHCLVWPVWKLLYHCGQYKHSTWDLHKASKWISCLSSGKALMFVHLA